MCKALLQDGVFQQTANDLYEEVKNALDNAETALEVDAIFENLKSTASAETVKFIAEKLDKEQETRFKGDGPITASERKEALDEAKEVDAATDPDEIAELQKDIDGIQALTQVVLNIAKIRGDESYPVTKAIVEEMKKLSTEEYNSATGLIQAFINIEDKLAPIAAKPAPKANPFAKLDKPKAA